MDFKLLKFIDRYESTCTDNSLLNEDGKPVIWHEGTWGLDCDPVGIKREALLLAEDAKLKATYVPEEIVIPVATKPLK